MRQAAIVLLSASFLAACESAGATGGSPQTPMQVAASAQARLPPPTVQDTATQQQYRIGPLDTLEVSVFLAPELARVVQVDGNGQIQLPLIGSLAATGMTAQALAAQIEDRLRARYIREPQVTVFVKEAVLQRITVDGAVQEPGVFPITGRTTLLQAVAMAKGAEPVADLKNVVVFRTVSGVAMAARFDLTAIRAGAEVDPELFANDTVVVDTSRTRRLIRDFAPLTPLISVFRVFVPY